MVGSSVREVFVRRTSSEAGSALTRRLQDCTPDWIACHVLLLPGDLPSAAAPAGRATIEVHAICHETTDGGVRSGNSKLNDNSMAFIAFETNGFRLTAASLADALSSGGDGQMFECSATEALGNYIRNANKICRVFPAMQGMTVLRSFTWTLEASGSTLSFETKLVSAADGDVDTGSFLDKRGGDGVSLPNYHLLGYAWAVHVLGAEGGLRTAAEGLCGSVEDPVQEGSDGRLLRAWLWRPHTASLSGLRCGDVIVLAAKAISEQPNYPAHLLAKCAIRARECALQSHLVHEDTTSAGVADYSAFVAHDHSTTILPM